MMNDQESLNFYVEFKIFKQYFKNATIHDFIEKKIFNDFDLTDYKIYNYHIKKDVIYDIKK